MQQKNCYLLLIGVVLVLATAVYLLGPPAKHDDDDDNVLIGILSRGECGKDEEDSGDWDEEKDDPAARDLVVKEEESKV